MLGALANPGSLAGDPTGWLEDQSYHWLGPAEVPPQQKRLLDLSSSPVTKRSSPLERSGTEDEFDFSPPACEGPSPTVLRRPGWVPLELKKGL